MNPHIQPFLDAVRRGVEVFDSRQSQIKQINAHYRRMRSIRPWARRLLADRDIARRFGK